ncbi:MAG: anaerobic carbon-monoxide dehydrogenase catalytic subunit [bacterium]
MDQKEFSSCKACNDIFEVIVEDRNLTAFHRAEDLKPCPFGSQGLCCKNCAMGPCRLSTKEGGTKRGVCGATAATIAARNFARMIAAGAAAHSDHGRDIIKTFSMVAEGKAEGSGYEIKDVKKLIAVAQDFGIVTEGRSTQEIARELAPILSAEFGKQEGELQFIQRAPEKRQKLWRDLGVVPRGVDREVVEMMHRTHMGVDQDAENILMHGTRAALADGWGGSMLATEVQDILFGTPIPLRGKVNLGVLKKDQVNIIVHGHDPLLSEMLVVAAQDPEMIGRARARGAAGINLAGICCTANEILLRHGIPVAGNFLQQEMAILTGLVDAMVVDVQCIMQSLADLVPCYHTELITTSEKARIPGATHLQFEEHHALNIAKEIVGRGIENFTRRNPDKIVLPKEEMDLVAGFSHETINYMLGGTFRGSYRPLNDNIMNGRILGVAGVVGCNNPRVKHDYVTNTLVKELIKNNVLVVQTGCAAISCAKEGLLTPEAARLAGPGLAEVCETVGMPPVLHCGSCVDNSRLLMAATAMVKEGGLGDDISDLPLAGCAPEWMSEKAIAIGQYFVGSGVFTVFGATFPIMGCEEMKDLLFQKFEKITKGKWAFEPDPIKMAHLMIDHIKAKRAALGIEKKQERVLYDMAMRRALEV